MTSFRIHRPRILALLLAGTVFVVPVRADDTIVGTGGTSGVYFQLGRAICRLVEKGVPGLKCEAHPSEGTKRNLADVLTGEITLGVAQSDLLFHANRKSGSFAETSLPGEKLRALFSAHGEPFTLVARADSDIRTLADLKGRSVNIGNPGSGQRATMEVVMKAKGWTIADFSQIRELSADEQALALCSGEVQAMVYTVGHPNASVNKATGLCDAVLVPITDEAINTLVQEWPYYSYTLIPGGMYSGTIDDVVTFGVKAIVVTSSDVSEDRIYAIVKAIFDNLDQLRRMHPAFGTFEPRRMVRDSLTAPLHDGAVRYYKEHGLL